MPRVSGPTIPRWRLSAKLKELREQAGLTHEAVAAELQCSPSKIKKIEAGVVGVDKAELEYLLNKLYNVEDEELRDVLFDWQKQGKNRGWWVKLGTLSRHQATFIGLESSALRIRMYEPMVIPGLMQTEAYANAIDSMYTLAPKLTRKKIVDTRMERQKQFWTGEDDPTRFWAIVDEAALWREVGGPAVMHAQLMRILELTAQCTFQVVPFEAGGYPGTLGNMTIFDFEEDIHDPVVYVDGQAGIFYLEQESDIKRANLAFGHMTAVALSPGESQHLVMKVARQMDQRKKEKEASNAERPVTEGPVAEVTGLAGRRQLRRGSESRP